MYTLTNNKGFNLLEMIMALAFTLILMSGVYGFYTISGKVYSSGVAGQNMQDAANLALSKIIDGQVESGVVYRLVTSQTFGVPVGNSGLLYFCQDNPATCNNTDASARWYYLDATFSKLLYHHPTSNPLGYDVIYTAPTGSTMTLRFSPAMVGSPAAASTKVVEIDVALTQKASSQLFNNSGTASTFVLLRNHP